MGIKGLNKWLKANIGSAFLTKIPPIHTLFIDAKQFYYKSLELVPESEVIPVFLNKLQKIIETYTPSDTLFLAMDGPNPAAKFQTQRERKFKADYQENFQYPTEDQFQQLYEKEHYADKVNTALEQFLQQQINRPDIQSKEFLFSSGFQAGESEHKYLDYFRSQKSQATWIPNRNHYIVSNDNDLIFLALQFMDERFYIIKIFEFNQEETIEFVDISIVRRHFLNMVYNPFGNTNYGYNNNIDEKRVINDVIALSFLLGNDFIPSFPEIESFDVRSFQRLLNTYVSMNNNNKTDYIYLIDNDVFDVKSLKLFVSLLFRKDFRKFQNNFKNNLKEASQLILRTLNFTWIYYSRGCPSWSFYYPFLCSPSLKLAAPLMEQENAQFFDQFKNEQKTEPLLKTLITRPAYSTANIPWNIYKLKIPPSVLAPKYWPLIKPPQTVPMFNLEEILVDYKKALLTLNEEEKNLNRKDDNYFVYTKQVTQNENQQNPIKNDRFHYSVP